MPSCAFKICTNNSRNKNKGQDVTFHKFPEDELWSHKWVKVVREQRNESDWTPTNNSRICSDHFKTEDMYTTAKGYRKIFKSAVPRFQISAEATTDPLSDRMSPNSLDDVNISDLESIFESPTEAYLKKKATMEKNKKRKVMIENKNLKKRNKRLEMKCRKLKEIILRLKQNLDQHDSQI